ncbi:MAG: Rrf2 family transcriptional regulator [Puia sp.]|nr:Rrf2 family transcriptional regulator [Puia sp.]
MLSLTCKTAIKAVIYLASKSESGEKSGVKEISQYISASEHTVGKLLQTLVKEGVINSTKGPSGGFHISKSQLGQPLIHIVKSIDGKQAFKECGLGLSNCSALHPCPLHREYKEARHLMERLFKENSVLDLCQPVITGLAYLKD